MTDTILTHSICSHRVHCFYIFFTEGMNSIRVIFNILILIEIRRSIIAQDWLYLQIQYAPGRFSDN